MVGQEEQGTRTCSDEEGMTSHHTLQLASEHCETHGRAACVTPTWCSVNMWWWTLVPAVGILLRRVPGHKDLAPLFRFSHNLLGFFFLSHVLYVLKKESEKRKPI